MAQLGTGQHQEGPRHWVCVPHSGLPTPAWCLRNEGVSSVLLGASSADQLMENIGAIQASWGGGCWVCPPPGPWAELGVAVSHLSSPCLLGTCNGPGSSKRLGSGPCQACHRRACFRELTGLGIEGPAQSPHSPQCLSFGNCPSPQPPLCHASALPSWEGIP